jgi:hypothetical protein
MYYLKLLNCSGANHLAFNGEIVDVSKIKITQSLENPPKRKNVMLSNNGVLLDINLEILDNYLTNLKYSPDTNITNLKTILKILGFECSHITIIETRPFNKITIDVTNIDINYLYY